MLLFLATSLSALLSVSSETLMPARLARCICSSCSTRRSSTWRRRTFCGGRSSFCSRRRPAMMISCSSSSLCSTTPSFTVAATRSSNSPELDASRVWACTPVAIVIKRGAKAATRPTRENTL
jgi:hypothetical protein